MQMRWTSIKTAHADPVASMSSPVAMASAYVVPTGQRRNLMKYDKSDCHQSIWKFEVNFCGFLKSGAIVVMTAGTAVMSGAAPTSPASNTNSPARMAAAYPMTLSAMVTMTVAMSLTSWSTCATHQHQPVPLRSLDVTMDTVYLRARCATGMTTAPTTVTRRDAVSEGLLKKC